MSLARAVLKSMGSLARWVGQRLTFYRQFKRHDVMIAATNGSGLLQTELSLALAAALPPT